LFDRLDAEIDGVVSSDDELVAHLEACAACRRECRMLSLPRAAAKAAVPMEASRWFYQKLSSRIRAAEDDEARGAASLKAVWKLAYRMVPALAGITLVLIAIFVWQQARLAPVSADNYERFFVSDESTQRMLSVEQNDITYESVLTALAERQLDRFPSTR
jgi:hypothetical protein